MIVSDDRDWRGLREDRPRESCEPPSIDGNIRLLTGTHAAFASTPSMFLLHLFVIGGVLCGACMEKCYVAPACHAVGGKEVGVRCRGAAIAYKNFAMP